MLDACYQCLSIVLIVIDMGNCFPEKSVLLQEHRSSCLRICKQNFQTHYVVGKGGFGQVWKVTCTKTKQLLAMKEMSKSRVVAKKSVSSVLNERELLVMLKHSFLVNMHYAFQDKANLYLVMDLLPGGDLRYHIARGMRFSEAQVRFFTTNLLLGLEYLHLNGVLHRDIKPENLVFSSDGFLHITDFGVAKQWRPDNGSDTSGTPGYMAPEVMCRMQHTIAVDYFAVGVIVYELMMGERPYKGRNRQEIRDAMISKQARIHLSEVPVGWSATAADFVNCCLERKPVKRLGYRGPSDIKSHGWFLGVDWKATAAKQVTSPFIPKTQRNFDPHHVLQSWGTSTACVDIFKDDIFAGYFYQLPY